MDYLPLAAVVCVLLALELLRLRWLRDGIGRTSIRVFQALFGIVAVLEALERFVGLPVWVALDWVRRGANTELMNLAGTPLTPTTVLTVLTVFFGSWWVSSLARSGLETLLNRRGIGDPGTVGALSRLCQYVLMGIGVAVGLDTLGLNLSAVFAAGAVFAVGIGLAMQQVAENFVSGVILLVERSIRPGDILEVGGDIVRVQHLGIRATIARTLDDEEVILPNSLLVQNQVKNLRLSDSLLRIRVEVGVAYSSDLRKTMAALERAAATLPEVGGRTPIVVLKAFGSSSVDFEVSVWTDDPWRGPRTRSLVSLAIWDALEEEEIVIAFPQLDVHFDHPSAA